MGDRNLNELSVCLWYSPGSVSLVLRRISSSVFSDKHEAGFTRIDAKNYFSPMHSGVYMYAHASCNKRSQKTE